MKEKISSTFRALKSRNYRLFFIGQCISLIGTWVQNVAMTWLIYSLTKSPWMMGMIMFVNSVPSILISPFAGAVVDRIDKYKAIILIQTLFGLQALALAALTLSGTVKIWHIIALGLFASTTMAFDMPLRQSFVINLVEDKKDLNNAISLNSSSFNLARLIGPAIAGVLIAMVGEGICFLLNAISYIAVIYALLLMKITSCPTNRKESDNILKSLKEGLRYANNSPEIKNILIFLATASAIVMSYPLLMPILAKEVLHGDAQTLGFLMSAAGIGSLVASLKLAAKKSVEGLPKFLQIGSFMASFGLIGLGFIHYLSTSLFLLFFIGFGMVSMMIASNTLLQHVVDNDKRGRIMSLYTIAFVGTVPLSNLFSGAIAQKIGILHTFSLFGALMLCASLVFAQKLKQLNFKEKVTRPVNISVEN